MNFDTEADDQIVPPPLWKRVVRALVALVLLIGVLYLFGVRDYFFFHRTPAGIEQAKLPSKVEAAEVTVPVTVHVLSGERGSAREDEDIYRLVENASHIWAQANVRFEVEEVRYIPAETDDLKTFAEEPHVFIEGHESYDPLSANVYLVRTLGGVNGLAYGGTSAVSVADYTASLDFRTLAHEFGHLLGLGHVSDSRRLMSSGGGGLELTQEEIAAARRAAEVFGTIIE